MRWAHAQWAASIISFLIANFSLRIYHYKLGDGNRGVVSSECQMPDAK
jgi:hypothetical protein